MMPQTMPRRPKVKPCHIFRLPPELRTTIYEHTLASTTYHLNQTPPLLATSRRIRRESLDIFYSLTHFIIDAESWWDIYLWLSKLSKHEREALLRVEVRVYGKGLEKDSYLNETKMSVLEKEALWSRGWSRALGWKGIGVRE